MPITRLLPATSFFIGQWSRKGAPSPTLAAGISPTDTTLSFSAPLKDENETVVAGKAFSFGIKKSNGWTETCTATSGTLDYDAQTANFTVGKVLTGGTSGAKALICGDTDSGTTGTLNLIIISGTFQDNETITDNATGSATANGTLVNSLSADGLTLSNVLRGIDPSGTDFITTNTAYADSHDSREPVFCNIPAFIPELFRSVLQGLLASGASDFIIGIDAAGTITIKRSTGVGTSVGFLRWYTTNSKAQYSNNGTDWINFDDTAASVIFKVSATDTTPGYALTKLIGSASITITQTNTGGNETLVFTTSLPTTISSHAVYTPAYLTGDTGAQTTIALWDSVSDGSFRATIDGTARNIDGINFTGTGALGVVTDMDDVAAVIQHYLRLVTGSTETVVWSTNHFILSSVNTTSSSQFSVLTTSTGTVGTDISGAGASDWMDADTGNGVATAAVLDATQDAGKLDVLDANGLHKVEFMPTNLQEANTFFGSTNISASEAEQLTDGSEVGTLNYAGAPNESHVLNTKGKYRINMASGVTRTFTSVTATDNGGYITYQTAAANNNGGGLIIQVSFGNSIHNKNPHFILPVQFAAATAQDAFIGCVSPYTIAGTSIEDSVMILDHFGFAIQDGACYGSVADGATQQKTTALTVTLTNVNIFEALFNGTTATFKLNGTSVGTLNTYVPNGSLDGFAAVIIADASAAAKAMYVAKTGMIQYDA